jgi:hypothetical protein
VDVGGGGVAGGGTGVFVGVAVAVCVTVAVDVTVGVADEVAVAVAVGGGGGGGVPDAPVAADAPISPVTERTPAAIQPVTRACVRASSSKRSVNDGGGSMLIDGACVREIP